MNTRAVGDYTPRLDARTILAGTPMQALLDSVTEEDKKQAGMDRAADGEGPEWREYAFAALRQLAERKERLFVDDLYEVCDWLPKSPNAWGKVWQRALKDKVIVEANVPRRKSQLPGKHAHKYPVYESLLYRRAT